MFLPKPIYIYIELRKLSIYSKYIQYNSVYVCMYVCVLEYCTHVCCKLYIDWCISVKIF